MIKLFFRTSLLLALTVGISRMGFAQMSVEINGPTTITTNNQILYTVKFYNNGIQVSPPSSGTSYWDNSGALVIQESSSEYRVNFSTSGSHWISYQHSTLDGYIMDYLDINVELAIEETDCADIIPYAPDGERIGSGTVSLVADAAPTGFGYQWYNAGGTVLLSSSRNFLTPELSSTTAYQLAYIHTLSECITEKTTVQAIITEDTYDYNNDYNYVKKYSAQTPTSSAATVIAGENTVSAKEFTYYDGLGRPMQQIQRGGSPTGKDIIVPIAYDEFGRQSKNYLPYTRDNGTESGNYRDAALSEQNAFYDDVFGGVTGDFAFAENSYDGSPLNRVLKNHAQGQAWAKDVDENGQMTGGGNRPVLFDYQTNDGDDRVTLWRKASGSLTSDSFYEPGTLYKMLTTNEEGNQMVEFKDLEGRVVLKQVQAPGDSWARTYYVYDDFGNMSYVLPPEASNAYDENDLEAPEGYFLVTDDQDYAPISGVSEGKVAYSPDASVTVGPGTTLGSGVHIIPAGTTLSQEYLDQWVFVYEYDERQRMTEKKVPGAGKVYLVYDRLDRVVLSQDGNQRNSNKWSFFKYDALNRVVYTGQKVIEGSLATIREAVASHGVLSETYTGTGITKYSDNAYPVSVSEPEILTVTYYDRYDFTEMFFGLTPELNSSADGKIIPAQFVSVAGQVTGTKAKILNTNADYIETVNFYDDRYRLIQSKVVNAKGGEDVFSTQYDFAGRVRKNHKIIRNPDSDIPSISVTQEYVYDHVGRLLTVTHQIENYPQALILSNTYNELGELVLKELADGVVDVDYAYNIRGWMTEINGFSEDVDDLIFEMDLEYDDAPAGHQTYNGNIGAIAWRNPYETLVNRYDYNYDEMDRLTLADYSNGGASSIGFGVSGISYDLNGNIKTLQRRGNDELQNPNVIIDQLQYNYLNGNQLRSVSDLSGRTPGFDDGLNGRSDDYLYDDNGNMTMDENNSRGMYYNILNLPEFMGTGRGEGATIKYDAVGTKLSKTIYWEDVTATDYIAGMVFEDGKAQFMHHDEGRALVRRNEEGTYEGFRYLYDMKDHLGNVRFTFTVDWEAPDEYLATLENDTETIDYEQTYFSRYGEVTRINADLFDHTDAGSEKTYSMRLNGAGNEVFGLAKSLEVYPGDVVGAVVWAKYLDPATSGASGTPFAQLIQDLSSNASSVVVEAISPGATMPAFVGLGGNGTQNAGAPNAYLNMMVFDKNYQQIGSTLYTQVSTAAEEDGTDVDHEFIPIWPITVEQPGYVYIYLSNENGTPVEVFFDDFKVTHIPSNILQKDDYYPFGERFNSYSRGLENDFLYNGKENLKHLRLERGRNYVINLYDFGARFYDPTIGRWTSPDPMASEREWVSPYNYVQNNPLSRIDPNGMLDDYYSREGLFLYRDTRETDNIRIIDQQDYDEIASNYGSHVMNNKLTSNLGLLEDLENKSLGINQAKLSDEAASNVFTDILSKMEGIDMSKLYNGKVSIYRGDRGYGPPVGFNDPETPSGIANTGIKGLTKPFRGDAANGTIKVTVNFFDSQNNHLSTVSNVQNALGEHEFQGHGLKRYAIIGGGPHYKAYEFQMRNSSPSWKKTTPTFQKYMKENYQYYKSRNK